MAQPDLVLGLNGQDQYVTVGTAETLGLRSKDFTVEAWIKFQSPRPDGPDHTILGGATPASKVGLHLVVRKGRLHFGFYGNDTPGNTLLVAGVWYHVAFRYTLATGEQALFVNGILDAAGTGHVPYAGTGSLYIGQSFRANFFHGMIAEVRIWGTARPESEIQATMFSRLSGSERSLSAYWPLDDGTLGTARDARTPTDSVTGTPLPPSAYMLNPGQLTGGAFIPAAFPVVPTAQAAGAAQVVAAQFDGITSYINVASSPALALQDAISVEAWVNPTGAGKALFNFPVVSKNGVAAGWELRAGAGQCSFMVTVNKVPQEAVASGLDPRFFYHLAGVYDGQVLRLYINGVLRTSIALAGPITQYPDVLSLGRNSYWPLRMFSGQVAEVRIFSRARSQAEIQQTMFTRLTGKEAGLVAQWQLAGDASDASPNGNHGTLRGVRWVATSVPLPPNAAALAQVAAADDPQKLRDELAQRYLDIQQLTLAKNLATSQLDSLNLQVATLKQTKDQLNAQVADLMQQLAAEKLLSAQVAVKQAEIDALKIQATELAKAGGAQTRLDDFVQNANDEITRAREVLKIKGSDYSLGRVTMEVKMLPGPGGVGMRFPQMEEIKTLDASHLSTLNVEFDAQDPKPAPKSVNVPVPSVLDYTEVMARRKLSESNFLVDLKYQAVSVIPGEPIQVDRVVAQMPLPGSAAASGSTVMIFIGRES